MSRHLVPTPQAHDVPAFIGVPDPEANYTKVPNVILANLDKLTSRAEIAVVLYITRHTWGYHEPEGKRISQDEFEHGRKRRGGGRLDGGTGLSRNAIKDGLRRAEANGFIIVEEEGDAGRLERYYSLRYEGEPTSDILQEKPAPPIEGEGQKLTLPGSEVDHGEGQKLTTVHRKKHERNPVRSTANAVRGPRPLPETYEAGQYYGLVVRMVEESDQAFECPNPECGERQPWPPRTRRINFRCCHCDTPLAGFLPDGNEPLYKPPRRTTKTKRELGALVPGCPEHLASIIYFEQDKDRLLHAMRKNHQELWRCVEWAWAKPLPKHKIVSGALEAFYNPKTVLTRATREAKKNAQRDPTASNSSKPRAIVAAHDF